MGNRDGVTQAYCEADILIHILASRHCYRYDRRSGLGSSVGLRRIKQVMSPLTLRAFSIMMLFMGLALPLTAKPVLAQDSLLPKLFADDEAEQEEAEQAASEESGGPKLDLNAPGVADCPDAPDDAYVFIPEPFYNWAKLECRAEGHFITAADGYDWRSMEGELFEVTAKNNDDLVAFLKKIAPLIRNKHPDMDIVLAFDNSMSHHKKAPNALDATVLPLKNGGKNTRRMRDTKFMVERFNSSDRSYTFEERVQKMQNEAGEQKGIKTILIERHLWVDTMLLECQECLNKS